MCMRNRTRTDAPAGPHLTVRAGRRRRAGQLGHPPAPALPRCSSKTAPHRRPGRSAPHVRPAVVVVPRLGPPAAGMCDGSPRNASWMCATAVAGAVRVVRRGRPLPEASTMTMPRSHGHEDEQLRLPVAASPQRRLHGRDRWLHQRTPEPSTRSSSLAPALVDSSALWASRHAPAPDAALPGAARLPGRSRARRLLDAQPGLLQRGAPRERGARPDLERGGAALGSV